jgi:hypothetical protein
MLLYHACLRAFVVVVGQGLSFVSPGCRKEARRSPGPHASLPAPPLTPTTPTHPPTHAQVLSKTQTRKLMQAVASLGPAACLLKLAIDHGSGGQTAMDAAAMVTAWLALCGFSAAGYGSNHQVST